MITVQDIREMVFDRAVRGYDMAAVDDFLDQLAADYATLTKENSTLKSKMKVLAEKIEEYRQTEDSMRLALLSAQKMSAEIEQDARAKAEAMVSDAQKQATAISRQNTIAMANESAKLEEAKKATKKYADHMIAVCEKQMEFYQALLSAQLVEDTAQQEENSKEDDEEETVRSIDSSVEKAALQGPEETIEIDTLADDEEEDEEEDEDMTRRFVSSNEKKKRSRVEFSFDDDDEEDE